MDEIRFIIDWRWWNVDRWRSIVWRLVRRTRGILYRWHRRHLRAMRNVWKLFLGVLHRDAMSMRDSIHSGAAFHDVSVV